MVECKQFLRFRCRAFEIDAHQSLLQFWNIDPIQARADQHCGKRVNVVSDCRPVHDRGLERRCAASHEWIVYRVAGSRQSGYEELRELRLEACPVRHFVQGMRLALGRSPILVEKIRYFVVFNAAGFLPVVGETANVINKAVPVLNAFAPKKGCQGSDGHVFGRRSACAGSLSR